MSRRPWMVAALTCAACVACSDEPASRTGDDRPDEARPDAATSRAGRGGSDSGPADAGAPDQTASERPRTDAGKPATKPPASAAAEPTIGATPCTGDDCLPELPELQNVVARVRGDTLLVDFAAFEGALDYRIYPLPESGKVETADDGRIIVRDAIYRCSGDRPRPRRDRDGINLIALSLAGQIHGYMRSEAEARLGYVFSAPGKDRDPVYRLGDPNRNGGYTWPYAAPPGIDYTGNDYTTDASARDALLAKGWRDDGVAFYVPHDATRKVYRVASDSDGSVLYYNDGPEAAARSGGVERFRVLADAADGSVPLYRVFYASGADHDVLAAGEVERDRVLNQGNIPFTGVTWPGMREQTTYVIEALDQGCPFPGGLIGASAVPDAAGKGTAPVITLDQARDPDTGEAFVNGQHEAGNHPRAVARAYVTAAPEAAPKMDWFMGFDQPLSPFQTMYEDGNGVRIYHNDKLSVEFAQANVDYAYGTVLDQLTAGSSASYAISARGANARLGSGDYLHVTMSSDIASSFRRYPQIFISDTPIDPESFTGQTRVITARFGPYTFEMLPPGPYHTIVVQVFGPSPELQVEFCDQRGWGVSDQCPRANIYGFHAGSELSDWTAPWLPVPVLGEHVGLDRPVKFDVYASTERVYVFVEDKPAGCAVLPAGRMPDGDVTVVFGAAGYHIDVDEFVERDPPMHEFWQRESLNHVERKMDDLGISSHVQLPAPWDESVLPCGDRFYE